jgi:hypothetical protein
MTQNLSKSHLKFKYLISSFRKNTVLDLDLNLLHLRDLDHIIKRIKKNIKKDKTDPEAGKLHHHLDQNHKKINTEIKDMIDMKEIEKVLIEIGIEEMIETETIEEMIEEIKMIEETERIIEGMIKEEIEEDQDKNLKNRNQFLLKFQSL